MRYLIILFTTILATGLMAQIDVEPFEKLAVNGSIALTLEKTGDEAVTIHGDREDIKIRVNNGTLRVTRRDLFERHSRHPVEVTVSYKYLRSIRAGEGAKLQSREVLDVDNLEMSFSTGAHGLFEVKTKSIDINVGEGGSLSVEGGTDSADISVATGANIKCRDLMAKRVFAKATTGGYMHVHATELLEASASLGGSIIYSGNPEREIISEKLGGHVGG